MRFFFMHIPKTAGTSFRVFLEDCVRGRGGQVSARFRDQLWSSESVSYPDYREFVSTGIEGARKLDLVSGHYPWHVQSMLGAGFTVVTVLREPIARCVSHIKHQMAYEEATGTRVPDRDVNAFVENPRNRMFLETIGNLQVKYFDHDGEPSAVVRASSLSLDRALDRCLRSEFGVAEDLATFQLRLARNYFPQEEIDRKQLAAAHRNRSQDPFSVDHLTPGNRTLLTELNELDQELFRLARRAAARG